MDYESALEMLDENGFSWDVLREVFPFGDIALGEGNYQKLVLKVLGLLETKEEKELLLDLLDTQNCVFLEQVWIQNDESPGEDKPFAIHSYVVTTQLQINSDIRWEFGLERRDARAAMLNLPESELLLDRMLITEGK